MRRRALLSNYSDNHCLRFTAEEPDIWVGIAVIGTLTQGQSFEYSRDGLTWQSYTYTPMEKITLSNVGDTVYFRGENTAVSEDIDAYCRFQSSGTLSISGDVTSLLNMVGGDVNVPAGCFFHLFTACLITSAPNLPSSVVGDSGYLGMFYGQTALETAPALPATTLGAFAYSYMFVGCTALETAPALPATTLGNSAYASMFEDCTALKVYATSETGHTAPWPIPASGTASEYTAQRRMFYGTTGDYATATYASLNQTYYTQNTPIS